MAVPAAAINLVSPFRISVEESKLEQLKHKLSAATFPDELQGGVGWDYGVPLEEINRLVLHWKNTFDWRKQEEQLNQLSHFQTVIDVSEESRDGSLQASPPIESLNIHFLHHKSEVKGAIPLLFVHGWPGSFLEVTKMLPLLTIKSSADLPTFHIVAPSLPNFGFSEGPRKRGFSLSKYAQVCHKLMLRLGYDQYVTQGGDWGYLITRAIGYLYPQSCKASHVNMVLVGPPKWTRSPRLALAAALTPYSEMDRKALSNAQKFASEGNGYLIQQSTRPQTLGYALADSPVGLLAWIYEKLHDWTDNYPWTDDEILTWISLFWFSSAGPAASLRIYYESFRAMDLPSAVRDGFIPHVKYGIARLPKEVVMAPRSWYQGLGNIVQDTDGAVGGHFAAWEQPEFIANEVKRMFRKGSAAYGVIEGKDGY